MTEILIRRLMGYSLEELVPWQKITKTEGSARFARSWRQYNSNAIKRVVARAADGDPHAMRWVEERLAKIEAGENRGWERSQLPDDQDDEQSAA